MATMPTLPPLPGRGKAKAPRDCSCGCGGRTKGGNFIPGHDAVRLAWAIRIERGITTEAELAKLNPGMAKAASAFVKVRAAEAAKASKQTA